MPATVPALTAFLSTHGDIVFVLVGALALIAFTVYVEMHDGGGE